MIGPQSPFGHPLMMEKYCIFYRFLWFLCDLIVVEGKRVVGPKVFPGNVFLLKI